MNRQVVITGIGLLAPNGVGSRTVWSNTLNRKGAVRRVTKFDTSRFPAVFGGEVTGFEPIDFMPSRLARKLDPYTQYAIAACAMALKDAEVDLEKVDRQQFGVYVGNCFGGWTVTDRELRHLYTKGVRDVSPHQATAWFPAAPQGQVSILFGLRGHSKTIVCDRASGLASVGYAARSIAQGHCDIILAGGTEAVMSPLPYSACLTEGILNQDRDTPPEAAYRPFDAGRHGLVPGEGAAFLVLEDRAHAIRRRARIYGEIRGFGLSSDACHPAPLPREERGLSIAMRKAIDEAGIEPSDVSFIMADGMATIDGDAQEAAAIHKVFGALGSKVKVTAPKSMFGHLYGAGGAMDAALAAMGLFSQTVPPTTNVDALDASCDLAVTTDAIKDGELRFAQINSRGSGGMNASMIIGQDRR
ncbi:beta-ketoacyl-[acyl-carrier-protein] synthase family protein [Sorangium sp. So ce302]|uniref:beta-ketoacyl-[acyl-carrier-protein] synthase family protein n=1 Tax=Sorangium sp. So ce302 TaxID=3133297 RepID=UPI003F60D803